MRVGTGGLESGEDMWNFMGDDAADADEKGKKRASVGQIAVAGEADLGKVPKQKNCIQKLISSGPSNIGMAVAIIINATCVAIEESVRGWR